MHHQYKEIISALHECAAACDHCHEFCLKEEHVKMMANCIRLDAQCAALCTITASFLAQNSEYAGELAELNARVCAECAAECEQHDQDHCKACAAACRKCETLCSNYDKITNTQGIL